MREYNLFISHSWRYSGAYDALDRMLKNAPYFSYNNYSVPSDRPLTIYNKNYYESELKNKIREKMKYCSAIIVPAGVYATHSESMKMEIEIAQDLNKPIIAVEPYGAERTSTFVINAATKVVKWNTNSIVSAIKEVC